MTQETKDHSNNVRPNMVHHLSTISLNYVHSNEQVIKQ